VLALASAWRLKRITGASVGQMLSAAHQMSRRGDLALSQALTAAIAPVLFQRSMLAGDPEEGLMATGLIAGRLGDLPSCDELVQRIIREAYERLAALGVPVDPLRAAG